MTTNNDARRDGVELTQNMLTAVSPEGIYSQEIRGNETTVIMASEVIAAMGGGSSGNAAGGGGTAVGRPVAVISIGPTGNVDVQPVVDSTKIAVALITVLGSFLLMLGRLRKILIST